MAYGRLLRLMDHFQPGNHLCCIYATEAEHRAVLTPFLCQGLERGEKVLYIADAHTAEVILGYLRDEGVDVDACLERGQFAILSRDDAYMREGVFDPERIIALLQAETERALAEGYPALRVTGEMSWALRGLPGSERLIEYEAKLNEFFPGSQCLAICQYDRRRLDAALLLDVLRTHPIAIIGTGVYDNFYYIPPAEFLNKYRAAVELQRWEQNLARRKRVEEEVERRSRELAALNVVATAVSQSLDLRETMTIALDATLQATGFEVGGIGLWNEKEQRLEQLAARGVEPEVAAAFLGPLRAGGHRERLLRYGQPVFHDDASHDPTVNPEIARAGFTIAGMVPLVHAGKVLGILGVATRAPRRWTEEDKSLLMAVGQQVAVAIANAQLYEEMRQSEEKYRSLVNTTNDLIFTVDVEGKILFANPAAKTFTGYEPEEAIGHHFSEYVHPEDVPILLTNIQQALSGEPLESIKGIGQPIEYRMRKRDGQVIWVQTRAWPVRDAEGRIVGYSGITHDITEQKRAEAALQRRDAILSAVAFAAEQFLSGASFDESANAVLTRLGEATDVSRVYVFENHVDEHGTLLTSQRYEWVATGITPQIGNPELQNFPWIEGGFERWVKTLSENEVLHGLVRDFPESERPILEAQEIISILIVPIFVGGKWWGFIGFDDCRTEREWSLVEIEALRAAAGALGAAIQRHQAEEALRDAEARYRTLVEQLPAIIYIVEFGKVNRTIYISPQVESLLGFSQAEWLADADLWIKQLHPDDRERVLAEVRRRDARGEPLDLEYRVLTRDGRVLWFRNQTTLVRDETGRIRYSQGIMLDVTERKRAEEALRLKMEQLTALSQASQAVTASLELNQVLAEIVSLASKVMGADYTSVALVDEAGHLSQSTENLPGIPSLEYRARDEGFTSWMVRSRQAVVVDEIGADGTVSPYPGEGAPCTANPYLVEVGIRSFASLPLIAKGRLLGVLYLHSLRPRAFQGQLPLLTTFANYAAIALENARLYTAAQKELAARKEAEEAYRVLVEHSLQGIAVIQDGRVVFANPALVELSGYSQEELLALSPEQVKAVVHPEDRERIWGNMIKRLAGEPVPSWQEFRFLRKDGQVRWVETLASRIEYQGRPAVQAAYLDITERKQAEEALRRRAEELAALQATVLDIIAPHDLPTLLQTIVERAARLLHAPGGGIYLCDPDRQEVRCVVCYNTPRDYTGTVLKYGEGAAGVVAQTGQPLIIDDYRTWNRRAAVYEKEQPFRAVLSAPMIWQGQVRGVIHALHYEEGRRFTEADLELLTLFANHAAIALENAHLLEETRQRAAEAAALLQTSLALTTLDLDSTLRTIGERAKAFFAADGCRVFLLEPDGETLRCVLALHERGEAVMTMRPKLGQGVTGDVARRGEAEIVNDMLGDPRAIQVPGTPVEKEAMMFAPLKERERVIGVMSVSRLGDERPFHPADLELLKAFASIASSAISNARLFEGIRQLQEFNQSIIQSMTEGILMEDADGICTFVNPAAAAMLGYTPEELVGQHWTAVVPPDQQPIVQAANERRGRGESDRYELELVRKDGTRISVLVSGSPRFEDGRFAGTLAVFTDITARKWVEEERRQSYLRLQRALESTVQVLISAVEMRDPYTAGHQRRVAQLACAIAQEMGFSQERIESLRIAGLTHDVGKISIPAEILSKPGKLTEIQWSMIKAHPQISYEILKEVEFPWPVAEMVLQHHERMDGSGYPQGLLGEDILLEARILAVADVVEAMASYRPYRPAHGVDRALEEIAQHKGILYDPEVVDACLRLFAEKRFEFE